MSSAPLGIAGAMHYASSLDITMGFLDVSWSRAILVVWLPFIFIPLAAVQFQGVPADQNNDASAILNLTRNLGGSVGVAIATTELAWRGQYHHARLAEHIGAFNGYEAGHSLAAIGHVVETQSSVMSYLDEFIILAVAAFRVAPLALFLPNMAKGAFATGH